MWNNEKRAETIDAVNKALEKIFGHTQGSEPIETNLQDMLTNLMHWCDRRGVDFADLLHRAKEQYREEKSEEPVRVMYRRFPEGDVIALFPDTDADGNLMHCMSYQHIGQHGAAHKDLIKQLPPATLAEEDVTALHAELLARGYFLEVADPQAELLTGQQHNPVVQSK